MALANAAGAADLLLLRAGTPLDQSLEQLRHAGLRLVYSSVLVTPSLQLHADVSGDDPIALAREVLRPHGLRLRPLGSGLLAVVSDTSGRDTAHGALTVTGTVRDATDSRPIPGARVEVEGQRSVAWTDTAGGFRTAMARGGTYALRVSAGGFDTVVVPVIGSLPGAATVDVRMSAVEPPLEAVTIVASRYAFEDPAAGRFVLDQQAIIAQPKFGEDALQSVARLPGMAFSGHSGRPNVRGGEASETLVLLDGMPLREPFHLPDYNSAFSALDETLIARLTTYAGALPARFGNRLSAVMDLESVETDQPSRHAVALSSFNARVRTGSAHGDEHLPGWLATARLGTVSQWLPHAAPDLGTPHTRDAFMKVRHELESGWSLRAQALFSGSRLEYSDPDLGEHASLRSDSTYGWLAARKRLEGGPAFEALLGYSVIDSLRGGNVAGGLTSAGFLRDERSARLWDLQLRMQWQSSAWHQLEAGLSLASGKGSYDYRSDVQFHPSATLLFGLPASRTRSHRVDTHRDLLGFHLTDKRQLATGWYLESGLRLDHEFSDGASRRTYTSPRLALRWDIAPLSTLRLSWGRALQAAEAHELRMEDGELALPVAQRVDQAVLSIEQQFTAGLALRLEGFDRRMPHPRQRFENLFDPLRVLPDLSADRVAVAPERSRSRGVELSAHWERGPWSLWGAYTRMRAMDRIEGLWTPREWDQRSTLALSLAWERGPWSLSILGSHRSGRPGTPFRNSSLVAPDLGPRHSQRLPGYLSVDARAARRFALGSGTLIAYAQVTNLLNRTNRCCTELDLPDEDSDPAALEIQPLGSYPLVPALGFSYEF